MILRYVLSLSCVAVFATPWTLTGQEAGMVRGRVTDASTGTPLANVQVGIEGLNIGALSRPNGEFLIPNVPAGAHTLLARRTGYSPGRRQVTITAGQTLTADFALTPAAIKLGEVIVTGVAAPAERRVLGNTVETVAGEEVSEAPGATAIDQALQGKITGAVISENSGQPGGGVSIRLRGTNSILGGAEPLYVLDGVIVDNSSEALVSLGANAPRGGAALSNRLADLDPDNIERIEVLKGAAAAALYGSRANNGVIQIFTKRGRAGETNVTFTTEYAVASTPDRYDLNMAPTAGFTDVTFGGADSVGTPVQRFDIQDQIFRTAHGTKNQLSVSGGSGRTSYFLSGGYDNEQGIIRSTNYERLNLRANLSQQISSKLDLAVRGSYTRSEAEFIPEGEQTQGVLTSVIFTPTSFNPAFNDTLGRFPYNPILGANPLDVIARWEAPEAVSRLLGGVEATARPFSNVTVRYLIGLDDYRQESRYFQPPFSIGPDFTGLVQNPVSFSRLLNNDLTVTHIADPTSSLGLTSTAGFRYTSDRREIVRAEASDLPPGQELVTGATQVASQSVTEFRTIGWFLEERVSINDRVYLTGGLNWDASSAFGPDERVQLFPRASVSYVLGEEPFWRRAVGDAVSSLRLRAAYGETGGQPPGLYSQFENYVDLPFSGRPGLVASTIAGNAVLEPERQREFEVGFEAGFFRDRAAVDFTYYDKVTSDLVLAVPLAPTSGFEVQFQNIGELSNKGVEIGLTTVNVARPNFTWGSRLTYAANRNRIERLVTDADTLLFDYLNAVIEGEPIGVFYGGVYARDAQGHIVYQNVAVGEDSLLLPVRATDTLPDGSTVFANRIIGDPNPDFVATLSNTFDFGGNIQLSVLLDGRFGNDVANFTRRITELFGVDKVTEREITGDTIPRTFSLNPAGRSLIYEEYIEDGSYVKLREVALQFTFDQPFVRRLGADRISLRVAGRNLYTWSDYRGLDPEINLFSASTVSRGVDFATTPLPRQFTFGLTLGF